MVALESGKSGTHTYTHTWRNWLFNVLWLRESLLLSLLWLSFPSAARKLSRSLWVAGGGASAVRAHVRRCNQRESLGLFSVPAAAAAAYSIRLSTLSSLVPFFSFNCSHQKWTTDILVTLLIFWSIVSFHCFISRFLIKCELRHLYKIHQRGNGLSVSTTHLLNTPLPLMLKLSSLPTHRQDKSPGRRS